MTKARRKPKSQTKPERVQFGKLHYSLHAAQETLANLIQDGNLSATQEPRVEHLATHWAITIACP
jgi:hypothetical protein